MRRRSRLITETLIGSRVETLAPCFKARAVQASSAVNPELPGRPVDLDGVKLRFYEELGARLAATEFARLRTEHVSMTFDDVLQLTIRHPQERDHPIRAFVRSNWMTIFLGDVHEDFDPMEDNGEDGPDAVSCAVTWILDALAGRIETHATYRGYELLTTRYVRHGEDGAQYGAAGFLTPAQVKFWQPKRRIVRRPSWS